MQIESRAATGSAAHNLRFCCCDQTTKAMTTIRAQEPERPTETRREPAREREREGSKRAETATLQFFLLEKKEINY
jgi:hypothetical protein